MTIEYKVLKYLNDNLRGVSAYMEEPKSPSAKYVLMEKTGSSESDHVKTATFALQSYGSSMEEAVDLNEEVKDVMENFWESADIYACKLNSDYNFTDTQTKRYRYQAVYNITY